MAADPLAFPVPEGLWKKAKDDPQFRLWELAFVELQAGT